MFELKIYLHFILLVKRSVFDDHFTASAIQVYRLKIALFIEEREVCHMINQCVYKATSSFFSSFFKIFLYMLVRERERDRDRNTETGRGGLP